MLQQILTYAERKSPSLTRNSSGAKVDVAANREKPKNPRIPARTYEGCNHREQKQMWVLRSREERAQTRPHRRRAMQTFPPPSGRKCSSDDESAASRHGVHPPRPGSPTLRRESRGSGGDLAGDLAKLRERFGRRAKWMTPTARVPKFEPPGKLLRAPKKRRTLRPDGGPPRGTTRDRPISSNGADA
jgi:hypothetical protein